jgi:hypothetical protein
VTATADRRRTAIDLAIIILTQFVALGLAIALSPAINDLALPPRIVATALFQFAIAGLGPLIVLLLRRESPADYGLLRRRLALSLALGLALTLLYVAVNSLLEGELLWIPLKRLSTTAWSLQLNFPLNALGLALTILAWGVFESFTWLALAKKVDDLWRTPVSSPWLAPGPLIVAVGNGLLHLGLGQGWVGLANSFLSAYFVTLVPRLTGNAWGGILVQTLTNGMGGG